MPTHRLRQVHYGWVILVVGTLVVFGCLGLVRFGYSMVLPTLQADLSLNNGQVGLMATLDLVGYLIMSLLGGILASRYGAKNIIMLGLILISIGMIQAGLAVSYRSIVIWRCLTGIGSGAANVAIMGIWSSWFAKSKRGLASGISVSGSSLALISTGFLVPWINSNYYSGTWRICWIIYGCIAICLAIVTFLVIRNRPAELGLIPIGEEASKESAGNNVESKSNWRQVYRIGSVWRLGLIYIAFGFSYIIYMTFFIKHLVSDAGFTIAEAGRLFMMMGWFSLFSGIIWGIVSDRIGRSKTLIILYLIHSLAFGLFAVDKIAVSLVISAILFGLSAWSIPAIMAAFCGDKLGPQMAPVGLGFITLFFGIGQALGPFTAGKLADGLGSFSPGFWLASVVALSGAIGTYFLNGHHLGKRFTKAISGGRF